MPYHADVIELRRRGEMRKAARPGRDCSQEQRGSPELHKTCRCRQGRAGHNIAGRRVRRSSGDAKPGTQRIQGDAVEIMREPRGSSLGSNCGGADGGLGSASPFWMAWVAPVMSRVQLGGSCQLTVPGVSRWRPNCSVGDWRYSTCMYRQTRRWFFFWKRGSCLPARAEHGYLSLLSGG